MAVAYKQFVILMKIKVYRVLKAYYINHKRNRMLLQRVQLSMQRNMKTKIFNLILSYAAEKAIKKAQVYRAFSYRRNLLIRSSIAALKMNINHQRKLRDIVLKANVHRFQYMAT